MKSLLLTDIQGPAIYAGIRDEFRKRIIALKRPRRVCIGDRVSMVFENHHTLVAQVEEMARTENLTSPAQIQAEVDVYQALMPTEDSLSATLFLEVPPGTDARTELDRLIGLDEHVVLHIGDHAIRAAFEEGRGTTDRISAVQYTRYPLDAAAKQTLLTPGTQIKLEIDHPNYQYVTVCGEETRASLAADYLQE